MANLEYQYATNAIQILPKYTRPLRGIEEPIELLQLFSEAAAQFIAKEYKQSALTLLKHINALLVMDVDINDEEIEISHMHGSAEINIKINSEQLSITAPFLQIIDNTNRVALLRKVAEINFSNLTLAHIVLRKNELWFEYQMPLDLCHPTKLYNVLREICIHADSYSEAFITDYKADYCREPTVYFLSEEDEKKVWTQFEDIFADYKKYTAIFRKSGYEDSYKWKITSISLLKIANMSYVQGKLKHLLNTSLDAYFNDLSIRERDGKSTNLIKSLCAKTKEEIMANIYHTQPFFSLRLDANVEAIKNWAKSIKHVVEDYEEDGYGVDFCYYLIFQFLKLRHEYNLMFNYRIPIEEVLEATSEIDARDASSKLLAVFHDFLGEKTAEPEDNETSKSSINDTQLEIFKGFNFANFWEDCEYAKQQYIEEYPTDETIQSIETELGYKLPNSYIKLMRLQNGGIPLNNCFPTDDYYIAITGIMAIGRSQPYSLGGDLGSQFMIEQWGYPEIGICICDCPSAGHDMVMLNYTKNGKNSEPEVVHVNQADNYKVTFLAKDFATFIKGLVHEDVYE